MRVIPDDELERLAAERGSMSYQAGMLAELRERRAKDERFELGEFLVIGPMPTPQEETRFSLAYEATKHLKASERLGAIDAILGDPDEIITRAERMRSPIWVCSSCSEMVVSGEPIPVPAPCRFCGGVAFHKA